MQKNSPAADVKTLCNALIHFDEESLKKIGLNPEDYKNDMIDHIANVFAKTSKKDFSESQIFKVRNAILGVYKRSTFETETVAENDDTVTVKITLSVFEKFTVENTYAKLPPNAAELSNEEQNDAVANALVAVMDEMQICGYFSFESECKFFEKEKMWLPVDAKTFGLTISTRIWDL